MTNIMVVTNVRDDKCKMTSVRMTSVRDENRWVCHHHNLYDPNKSLFHQSSKLYLLSDPTSKWNFKHFMGFHIHGSFHCSPVRLGEFDRGECDETMEHYIENNFSKNP